MKKVLSKQSDLPKDKCFMYNNCNITMSMYYNCNITMSMYYITTYA